MNIYEKMSAITADLSIVAKNLMVGEGRSSYKAAGEADVLAAVKPLEEKYKVYSYPVSRRIVEAELQTVSRTYKGETNESTRFFMRLETVYRFVNVENPDEFIDVTTYGDGVDSNDKAPGKAMTYGDKYALMKAYKIITGDDPDQFKSEDEKITKRRGKHDDPRDGDGEGDGPLPVIHCDECGAIITDARRRDGSVWPASEIAEYTRLRYGKALCTACGKAAEKDEAYAV